MPVVLVAVAAAAIAAAARSAPLAAVGAPQTSDHVPRRFQTFSGTGVAAEYDRIAARNSSAPAAELEQLRIGEWDGREFVQGHHTVLGNPAGHFDVLEQPDGCGAPGAPASVTAAGAACVFGVTAGFFGAGGECIGHVVSSGRVVQTSDDVRASFGLTQDGDLVAGYLSPADVEALRFEALVTGFVWLVRDGASFVDQAAAIEGPGADFVSLRSARTAVGWDAQGRILSVSIDGKSYSRGINLYALAQLMIELGAVTAVNLDGGGSVAVVHDSTVVSYPSDACPAPYERFGCERAVTTVLCIA